MTPNPPSTTETRSSFDRRILVGGVAALVLVAFGAWWFLLRDDSPAAFDIVDAAGAVDDGSTTTTAAAPPEGVAGTWTVDPAAGTEAGGSQAGFRVDEELTTVGVAQAVGRTSGVTATVVIDGTTVTATTVEVDVSSLATDDSRRDGRMRSALDTATFPSAAFELTEPIEFDDLPEPGEVVSVAATGTLTIKGVTNPVTVQLDAQIVDDVLVIVGSTGVVFADYGVTTPSAPIVVSVADEGTIEFQLFLRRS